MQELQTVTIGPLRLDPSVTDTYLVAACAKDAVAVEIPASLAGVPVTDIGLTAFLDCDALASVTIPDGVTDISFGAFMGCTALQTVSIPASVTTIDMYAFSGCTSLGSVVVPASCAVDDNAFPPTCTVVRDGSEQR